MVVNAPRGSDKCGEGASKEISRRSRADRIDSWASFNKVARSSRVNSPSVGEDLAACSSGCGNIALPPTAEDNRGAAALHPLPVNLGPECDEVIARRYQRKQNHEPDREPRDPMHGKKIYGIDGPLFPVMITNDINHGNNLHQHFKLAQIAGLDGESFGRRNR